MVLLYRFIRFAALSFTLPLAPLGALTATPALGVREWLGLLAIGLAFHVFAYVSNDLVDLPLDRSEPLRRHYPLVTGAISPRLALVVAVIQVPLAFLVAGTFFDQPGGTVWLVLAFVAMTGYNLYGKRLALPILGDGVQAFAWASLFLFGRTIVSHQSDPMTNLLAAYFFVYVLLINGIHGGLRDLENDRRSGAQTTAVWMGAKVERDGGLVLPIQLTSYALVLQILLIAIAVTPVVAGLLPVPAGTGAALLVCLIGNVLILSATLAARGSRSRFLLLGGIHLVISLLPPFLLATAFVHTTDLLVLWSLLLVPLFPMWLQSQYSRPRNG